MGYIVFFTLKSDRSSLRIKDYAHFRHIQVQGALFKTPFSQNRRQLPGTMKSTLYRSRRLPLQNRKGLTNRSGGQRSE